MKTRKPKPTPFSAKQAIKELRAAAESHDTEKAHLNADHTLCKLLTAPGCYNVVKAFQDVPKWYS